MVCYLVSKETHRKVKRKGRKMGSCEGGFYVLQEGAIMEISEGRTTGGKRRTRESVLCGE